MAKHECLVPPLLLPTALGLLLIPFTYETKGKPLPA